MSEESKKENIGFLLKEVVTEWFLSSTSHALPNIFRTSNVIIKIIWLCCFLASTAYCLKSMYVTMQDYLEYPSYISTSIYQETPTKFPAVTICNIKTVKNSKMFFTGPILSRYILNPKLENSTFEYMIYQQYAIRTAISSDPTLTDAAKKALGFELKDMLVSCYFNYRPCDLTEFTYSYDPLYGNCYTFNKGIFDNGTAKNVKSVSVTGPLYGLILELYLGEPKTQTYYEFADGIIISVDNQTSSVAFTEDSKIMAATNAETDIIVHRNFIKKLESPYGDCLLDVTNSSSFSSFYFNYIVRTLSRAYSHKYCFALCIQKKIIDTCGCSNTFMPTFKENVNLCFNQSSTECIKDVVYTFGDSESSSMCQDACPFECESVQYEISSFRSYYPTEFYKSILANFSLIKNTTISYDDISKAVLKVNVYYQSMQYKVTEQKVKTSPEDFFSSLGGTLGLYIGISLLSFVEIIELIINLGTTVIKFNLNRKTKSIEKQTKEAWNDK